MRLKNYARALGAIAILILAPALLICANADSTGIYRGATQAIQFDISPPLRDIPPIPPTSGAPQERREGLPGEDLNKPFGLRRDVDRLVQTQAGPGEIPAPTVSFDGPDNISGVSPPDPNGDVGPNHVVVMSNLSFQVFNKTGGSLYGPALNNTLWAGFGGDCQTDNSGDPIVLYDQIADRWMLSQFTSSGPTYFNCVAISTTPDPTGTYYRYAFSTGNNFPDYPKYGFWSDALYISTREFLNGATFVGIGAYAINRAQLIAGNPAPTMLSFLVAPGATPYNVGDGLLPSDLDGPTLPPAGTPNFFVGSMDNGGPYGAPQDALTLWKFTADFTTPANSTFVLANTIPIGAYDTIFPCTPTSRSCIPQPGTANKIDILSYRQRPMWRLAYRNFGTHQSLVTNQSVEASANVAGIRWWEIRSPNSSPVLYQEGTYSPADGLSRWMGSIAQDNTGNMALGYSVSDAATFPGVRYTGRLVGDPLGTMPQGEGTIVNGTGSQTGSQRWGDYTSMSVDPVDDCTFWYVNQWIPTTSPNGWRLRIGAFKFSECKINQTIAFGANPGPVTYAPGGTFTVSATASSGLPVTFTSTTPGVCTVAGNTVTVVAVGNCIIAANQAGNANYNAAPQVTQTIVINQANQTITFGANPGPVTYAPGGTFTVSATASSGLPVTFTSTTPGVCTVAGNTVTVVAVGNCIIAANQAGNANYNAAPQVTQTIVINQANQTIAFGANPGPVTYAPGGTFTVSATASSGLPVTFTSTTPGVCTVAGNTVTVVAVGNCIIAANQAGNANYNAAPQVTQTIVINQANQTIAFGANPGPVTYAPGGTFTVSATASSGLPVTFTSTTPGVCTVAGNTVTVVAVGNCIIAANQAGNANYNAAPQVLQTIAVISGLAGGASIPTLQEWALLLLGLLLGSLVWRQSRRIGRMEE